MKPREKRKAMPPPRQYDRYSPYRDLSMTYEGRSEEIPLRVPDLSIHGMFINTPRMFAEGSVLKLTFNLTRTGYPVSARGEVRYCVPGIGVGVEFVGISEEAQAAIAEELEMDEAAARRRR
ncbi:MAG: PilZ domain-containing protein [Acidobacteria bacterium]|nr:PilZ domain-containing protein [Acidobacteriota bacterium]MBI3484572.1 PilZ domain-containing protein [Acidobacteriota bacterium]